MIPKEIINENEYRKKELSELAALKEELSKVLEVPRDREIKLRDDVNMWILNDLIREKDLFMDKNQDKTLYPN